jgi:hypothetical protein
LVCSFGIKKEIFGIFIKYLFIIYILHIEMSKRSNNVGMN